MERLADKYYYVAEICLFCFLILFPTWGWLSCLESDDLFILIYTTLMFSCWSLDSTRHSCAAFRLHFWWKPRQARQSRSNQWGSRTRKLHKESGQFSKSVQIPKCISAINTKTDKQNKEMENALLLKWPLWVLKPCRGRNKTRQQMQH